MYGKNKRKKAIMNIYIYIYIYIYKGKPSLLKTKEKTKFTKGGVPVEHQRSFKTVVLTAPVASRSWIRSTHSTFINYQ